MALKIVTLKPIKSRTVSADEFLVISKKSKDNIESSRFIPPAIGSKGMGKFKVTFKDKELVNG
jgi:hypothetical protein